MQVATLVHVTKHLSCNKAAMENAREVYKIAACSSSHGMNAQLVGERERANPCEQLGTFFHI